MEKFYNSLKENLGNFTSALTETAEIVVQKTEDGIEVQKIKSQIRVLERNNDRDYQDIGKMLYERFCKGEVEDASIAELCENIKEREKTIEGYIKQVERMKGMNLCRNCKEHVDLKSTYCPNCGAKIKSE